MAAPKVDRGDCALGKVARCDGGMRGRGGLHTRTSSAQTGLEHRMSSLFRKLGNLFPTAAREPAKRLVMRLEMLRDRSSALEPVFARMRAGLAERCAGVELQLHSAVQRAA